MASKTQMFKLLRLIEFGGNNGEVVREAWSCWRALSEATQGTMLTGRAADGRRARLWAAAWDGGMEFVLDHVEELEPQVKRARALASGTRTLVDLVNRWIDEDVLPPEEMVGLVEVLERLTVDTHRLAPAPREPQDVHPLEFGL